MSTLSFHQNNGFLWGALSVTTVLAAMYFSPITPLEHLAAKKFPTFSLDDTEGAIFITGCSSGIGRDAALTLAKEGYNVFATVRSKKDADSLLQEEDTSDRLHPVICDVTDAKQIAKAQKSVESWLQQDEESGKRRVLIGIVNNAGVAPELEFLEETPIETLDHIWNVNLKGPLLVYQAFLPLIRANGGRIVNVGSLAGQAARPFRGPYTISKFALEGMSDTQRQELLFENISVSMVNPGYIRTSISTKTLDDLKSRKNSMTPGSLKRDMMNAFEITYQKAFSKAGTTDETTASIKHALLSKKPRTRYYPGSLGLGPLQAWMLTKVKMILPDRMGDKFGAKRAPEK